MSEKSIPSVTHQERLKELAWLVGDWVDENSDSVVHVTCRWSDDKNFLLRDFVIHVQGKPVMNVNQRIGWDPVTKQIKSWVFDSEGGYGDALWARNGNSGSSSPRVSCPTGNRHGHQYAYQVGPEHGPLGVDRTYRGRPDHPDMAKPSWYAGLRHRNQHVTK